jgi:hypothetical protein
MVRSENFSDIMAMIVVNDRQALVRFMRSEGVDVNANQDVTVIANALLIALANSEVFKSNFITWAESRYQGESNYSGENYASGSFDPMSTQGSGQEFDAMSSQQGANLNEDGFANASGDFNPMDTQSGGFTPTSTQFANAGGGETVPYDPSTGMGGTKFGNALRKINWQDLLNQGVNIYSLDQQNKLQSRANDTLLKSKELDLKNLLAQGELSEQEYQRQLELARANSGSGSSDSNKTVLYVVGGVVLLGAIATAIYFATRKK